MDRNQKLLQHVKKDGWGVEIGPSYGPIAPKRDGYQVHIIDHLNQEQLVAKYTGEPVDVRKIEPVDFVWHGETFAELTGKQKFYDWVIASHVIEHTPDMIRFLNDIDAILKDSGVLSLAVPDRRFCLDYYRPITGLARIIDAHYRKDTIQTPGSVAEFTMNVAFREGDAAWSADNQRQLHFVHNAADAINRIKRVTEKREYIDIHSWCFTPNSFRLILQDLYSLGLTSLREVQFYPTAGWEFYVTLGRSGNGSGLTRKELLEGVERDLYEGLPPAVRNPAPTTRKAG